MRPLARRGDASASKEMGVGLGIREVESLAKNEVLMGYKVGAGGVIGRSVDMLN